jgi:hypothetical protein
MPWMEQKPGRFPKRKSSGLFQYRQGFSVPENAIRVARLSGIQEACGSLLN